MKNIALRKDISALQSQETEAEVPVNGNSRGTLKAIFQENLGTMRHVQQLCDLAPHSVLDSLRLHTLLACAPLLRFPPRISFHCQCDTF